MMMKLMAVMFRAFAALLRIAPAKKRIAFMSRQGTKLSLDFKLLQEELARTAPEVEVVTCLSEPEQKSKAAFIKGTLSQLKVASGSKVLVVDGYVPAVCIPSKRSGTQVVQLWHALGAVKKFGYQSVDTPAGRTSAAAAAACMHKNYDTIIAGGPGTIEHFAEAFGYPQAAVNPLGLPRVDYLMNSDPNGPRCQRMAAIQEANPFLTSGKRTVLYAPTLRKGEGYAGWLTEAIAALAANCDGETTDFVVAAHPLDNAFEQDLLAKMPWLHFVRGASTIDLLGLADCVITDYSAVALEAGVLGKPVYFYVPDIDLYRTSPGLNIDPLELFPSVSSKDPAAVMSAIARDASAGATQDPAFRQLVTTSYEGVLDGHCTARIAANLLGMLDNY